MRKYNKLVSALLVLVAVFSLLPISALAADAEEPSAEQAAAGSSAIMKALGNVLGQTVEDIKGTVGDVKEAGTSAFSFFGNVTRFINSLGYGKQVPEELLGVFKDAAGNTITVWRSGAELYSKALNVKVEGLTVFFAENSVTMTYAKDDDELVVVLALDKGLYTMTVIEVSDTFMGVDIREALNVPVPATKIAESGDRDQEEARDSLLQMVYNGSKIATTVFEVVEGVGPLGIIAGLLKGITVFGDSLAKSAEE